MQYSKFSVYDIEASYLSDWEVRLKQGSKKQEGSVIFCPSKSPQCVYMGWGELQKARSKFRTHREQAEDSVNRMVKDKKHSRMGVKLLGQRDLVVNGHEALENHFKAITGDFRMVLPLFAGGVHHEVRAVFFHCTQSDRYFVIVADGPPEDASELNEVMQRVIASLKCHI